MEKFNRVLIIMVMAVLLMSSCTTTEKICVYGKPNTQVYYPNQTTPAGTIPGSGKLKLEIPSNQFYGFLLAKEPNRSEVFPFGIDYKGASHTMTKASLNVGYILCTLGITGLVMGGIVGLVNKDETTLGISLGVGGVLGGLGAAFGAPADERMKQLSYHYNYTYCSNQNIPQNLVLTALKHPEKQKAAVNQTPVTQSSTTTTSNGSSTVKRSRSETSNAGSRASSKVKRSVSSKVNNVIGRYTGPGRLVQNGHIIEIYGDMEVLISKGENGTAKVIIKESGDEFFESPGVYDVTANSDGTYTLKMVGNSKSTIKIDKQSSITYKHDAVEIDGATYSLKLTATKRR